MKALVVGGTKGFGKFVSEALIKRGYEVITVGRTGGDFEVDVGEKNVWDSTLDSIRQTQGCFDVVIFVVGHARASDPMLRTKEDYTEHEQKNVGYIEAALEKIEFSKKARIVTLGSQWSYKEGVKELAPYIEAKHNLRELTKKFAVEHPDFSVAHMAAPPMNTPQRELVWKNFGAKPEQKTIIEVADPVVIAESLVNEMIEREYHGETLQIDSAGKIHEIFQEELLSENYISKK